MKAESDNPLHALPPAQKAALVAIWAGFSLLLLTPFVVTVETAYPYTVGKAVYSRSLIALIFALWVPLALANATFRPRRSWLLALLAAGLVVAFAAAFAGVNLERSLWSNYERMQGVVEQAHWLAFAFVVVSVVRTDREWRALLGVNVGISAAIALFAIGRNLGWDMIYLDDVAERSWRATASLGNSAYLGNYALLNSFVAIGLAAWLFSAWRRDRLPAQLVAGALCILAALLNVWALSLSGALGAYVAFVGGAVALAVGAALFAVGRAWRLAAVGGLGVAGLALAVLAFLFFVSNPLSARTDNPVLLRLSDAGLESLTTRTRLAAWEAGIKGLAERPVLGWGPDNYLVVYGKHGGGIAATHRAHDYAHSELVETAATKGIVGVAVYVALWILTLLVLVRHLRAVRRGPPEAAGSAQLLPLFVGAALAAEVLFKQTLFPHIVGSLQYVLFVGFVIGLEQSVPREGTTLRRLGRLSATLGRWLDRRMARAAICVATAALALAAVYANARIHMGATALLRFAAPGAPMALLDETIAAFPPLANTGRRLFIDDLANRWRGLRPSDSRLARDLLARADAEAGAAEAAAPNDWMMMHSLVRLYREVALTEPGYQTKADYYERRSAELAPNMELLPLRDV